MFEPQGEIVKTNIAAVYLTKDHFVFVDIVAGARQSIADAKYLLDTSVLLSKGIRRGILVDLRKAEPLTAEVRQIYKGPNVDNNFVSVAMLIEASPFGRALGNFYINAAMGGIPKKLFTQMEAAVIWLKTFQ